MCCHEYVISLNRRELFVIHVYPREDRMVRGYSDYFTVRNIYFSKSYHNFPAGLFPRFILLLECIYTFDLLKLMDVLTILFLYICGKLG